MQFKTIVIHVDNDTGEIICKWDAIEYYTLIKTEKNVTINKEAFKGTIKYTKFYRRNSHTQGRLF